MPADSERIRELQERAAFGRFPLIMDGDFDGGVVDLARCFMADGRAVSKEDRILGLTDEASENLEIAWNAYVLRRGPLATRHNLNKLASRLAAGGDTDGREYVEKIEAALALAWRVEGGSLRDALDSAELVPDKLDHLIADLAELEKAAREAHERLSKTRLA
jgi:hypothetical protein